MKGYPSKNDNSPFSSIDQKLLAHRVPSASLEKSLCIPSPNQLRCVPGAGCCHVSKLLMTQSHGTTSLKFARSLGSAPTSPHPLGWYPCTRPSSCCRALRSTAVKTRCLEEVDLVAKQHVNEDVGREEEPVDDSICLAADTRRPRRRPNFVLMIGSRQTILYRAASESERMSR